MRNIVMITLASLLIISCAFKNPETKTEQKQLSQTELDQFKKAYFASGCFWCVEAVFESVYGVEEAISGYSGGFTDNPTYSKIGTGKTGHSEAVEVYYDPAKVTYETLLKVYYGSHDPTTVNGQSPDFGSQYRSMIYYQNQAEKTSAEKFKNELGASGKYNLPIATEIVKFEKFWVAEDYHQNYERNNPSHPYVMQVSIPRLNKFKKAFPELLKENHQ